MSNLVCDIVISFAKFNFSTKEGEVKCFSVWLEIIPSIFNFYGNTCENVNICFSSLLLYYHNHMGHFMTWI